MDNGVDDNSFLAQYGIGRSRLIGRNDDDLVSSKNKTNNDRIDDWTGDEGGFDDGEPNSEPRNMEILKVFGDEENVDSDMDSSKTSEKNIISQFDSDMVISDNSNNEDEFFVGEDENIVEDDDEDCDNEMDVAVMSGPVQVLFQEKDRGIVFEVKERINQNNVKNYPVNDSEPFNPSFINGMTTGEWVRKWYSILVIGGVPESIQTQLMLHLADGVQTSCNLPVVEILTAQELPVEKEKEDEGTDLFEDQHVLVETSDGKLENRGIFNNDHGSHDVDDQTATAKTPIAKKARRKKVVTSCYVELDNNDYTIDICKNGCMAFHGVMKVKGVDVDCSKLLFCLNPRCMAQRYSSSCKYCVDKPYNFCSPFKKRKVVSKNGTVREKAPHSAANRIPQDTMFFRSILAKIIEMYLISVQVPGQEFLLNYEAQRVKKDDCLIDILDGKIIQENHAEMNRDFLAMQQEYSHEGIKTDLHQLSLCMTLFYDGKMNFKRKADSMWPMLCSIMNCNPSHRSQLGIGLFLTALHNLSIGSGAEKYLMEELLVKELKALEDGMVFTVPLANGAVRHVYLQARCVYAHLDTKAYEKFALVKGVGSKDGCSMCNCQKGIYEPTLGKVIYGETRDPLHEDHILRFCGEHSFHNKTDEEHYAAQLLANFKATRKDQGSGVKLDNTAKDAKEIALILASFKRPKYLRVDSSLHPRVWENERFPLSMFINEMRFPVTAAHKDRVLYERRSHDNYKLNGDAAAQNQAKRDRGQRQKKDCSSDGIHGVCALCGLRSFRFTNFCYDFMHLVANVGKYFIDITKGDRAIGDKSRRLSVGSQKHPVLRYKKIDPAWKAGVVGQATVDGVMNTVLVPPLHKAENNIKNPMKHAGYMKFKEHLTYLTVYSSYCLSYSGIKPEYVNFAARYADDLCRILDPCIQVSDIERLIASVFETRAIQNGLFPESELVFIYHEIVDIVNHLIDFGHVRGLMCFAGERALGTIASSVSKGGVHYLKSLYHRYIAKERALFANLSVKTEYLDNSGVFSDFVLKMLDKTDAIVLTVKDKNSLLASTSAFLQSQCIANIFNVSSFYRLYKAFEYSKIHLAKNCTFAGFYDWIQALQEVYGEGDSLVDGCAEVILRYKHLVPGLIQSAVPVSAVEADNVGSFYFGDFLELKGDILCLEHDIHHKVIVKGISFQCRGAELAGSSLKTTYADKRQFPSWCRYKSKKMKYEWPLHTQVVSVEPVAKVKAPVKVRAFQVRPMSNVSLPMKRSSREITSTATENTEYDYTPSVKKTALLKSVLSIQPSAASEFGIRNGASTRATTALLPAFVPTLMASTHLLPTLPTPPPTPAIQTKFGQLNYCLRLKMSGDSTVDGLAFGNVTSRSTIFVDKRWHYRIADVNSNHLKHEYVCLNDLDSTAMALHPVADDKKFILQRTKRGYNNIQDIENQHKVYSQLVADPSNPCKYLSPVLSELFLIELHPERIKFTYDNIRDDKDLTKKREDVCRLVATRRKKACINKLSL